MDWPSSYYAYSDLNISHIWHVLKLCHEKGWLYRGHSSMPWCARCGTALSQHEMIDSYRERSHTSVFVRFPIVRDVATGRGDLPPIPPAACFVWTPSPASLPANVHQAGVPTSV